MRSPSTNRTLPYSSLLLVRSASSFPTRAAALCTPKSPSQNKVGTPAHSSCSRSSAVRLFLLTYSTVSESPRPKRAFHPRATHRLPKRPSQRRKISPMTPLPFPPSPAPARTVQERRLFLLGYLTVSESPCHTQKNVPSPCNR